MTGLKVLEKLSTGFSYCYGKGQLLKVMPKNHKEIGNSRMQTGNPQDANRKKKGPLPPVSIYCPIGKSWGTSWQRKNMICRVLVPTSQNTVLGSVSIAKNIAYWMLCNGRVETWITFRRLVHIYQRKSPWWPGPGSSCGKGEKWLQCLRGSSTVSGLIK